VTAPAERRHLVCLSLSIKGPRRLKVDPALLLSAPLKEAIVLATSSEAAGLRRALGRLGEVAWQPHEYLALLGLLGSPATAKLIRHAKSIDAALVSALASLPDAVVKAGVGHRYALTLHQASLISETWDALIRLRGLSEAEAEARRWGGATSRKALFEAIGDSLVPELPPPPFSGTDRFKPLATKSAIREAAIRYRNCLRNYLVDAADGEYAIYEWVGPPGVIVGLTKDRIFGWRLCEAQLAGNQTPPPAVYVAITKELTAWGVHFGRTAWELERAIEDAQDGRFTFG
jgi:hypothetical protein